MRLYEELIILAGLIMILVVGALFVYLGIMIAATGAESELNIDCNKTVYSLNWTLEYLRNVSAYCSNK